MRIPPAHCIGRTTDSARRQQNHSYGAVMILAAGCIFLSGTAIAQTTLSTILSAPAATQVRIIEWDLPADADTSPGAMVVDTQGDDRNRIWFVTRTGFPVHVYRMEFPSSLMKGKARWTSWELSDSLATGGVVRKIRPSRDRRFVFARTQTTLERIDTQKCSGTPPDRTCERVIWTDQDDGGSNVSDVAVDGYNNVFSTHSPMD